MTHSRILSSSDMRTDLRLLDLSTLDIRHLPGKHNQKDHAGKHGSAARPSTQDTVQGKDITEDIIDKNRDGNDTTNPYSPPSDFSDPVDRTLAQIGKDQGFDGKPTKGSVDEAVAAGGIEMHRGVRDNPNKPAQSIVDDMRDGPYEPGNGLYGNGYYFSTSSRVANEFALGSPEGIKRPKNKGATVRAALKKDAKVIDYDDLQREHKAWREKNRHREQPLEDLYSNNFQTPKGQISPSVTQYVLGDPGRFAAAMGYDAIRVRGKQDGAKYVKGEPWATHPESGKKFSAHDQYVVVNRTAMVVDS